MLTSPRPNHAFDQARLRSWIGRTIGDVPPLRVRQFAGGQSNPTFLVEAGDERWVLRKQPPGPLLPSAHRVDREYRVQSALRNSGVPVPFTRAFCADAEVIGTPFYLMDHVEGRIFEDVTLPGLGPDERRQFYRRLSEVAAALHTVDVPKAGLADFGRPERYIARQIARWADQYERSRTSRIDAMDMLSDWLARNIPEEEGHSLVHGDLRFGNLIFHPDRPEILAVLDWELATLGEPLSDLGYMGMMWHLEPGSAGAYSGVAGCDLAAIGIPTPQEFLDDYRQARGLGEIDHWKFYLALSFFRAAAIAQGVYHRALQGNAADQSGIRTGDIPGIMATRGLELAFG